MAGLRLHCIRVCDAIIMLNEEPPERNQDSTYIYDGPQVGVPKGIKLAKIAPNVKEIRAEAFVPTLISYGWGGPFYEESNLTHVDFIHPCQPS
jgi:hypothetical protein